jgi:hypothetical protein
VGGFLKGSQEAVKALAVPDIMVNFLRRKKGERKSLLGPKRFFGKKADRSDSVDGRSRFSKNNKEQVQFEAAPAEISLEEVDDSNLNVTILTEESTPPVTPCKYGEEGSLSDTISDLSASIVPCLPNPADKTKAPSPAEKMISTANHQGLQQSSRVSFPESGGAFTDHRGASQVTGDTNQTASTGGFSLSDMLDNACVMPWSSSSNSNNNKANNDDNTTMENSQGPSWGMAPSADDEDQVRTRSVDYPSTLGDTLPSVAEESVTLPSTKGDDTLPSAADESTQDRPETYVSDEEEEDEGDAESEEQEGYELVLDSATEEYVPKKAKGAVWKRMKISKAKSPTPSVDETEKEEKYRAPFGTAEPLSKRSNSLRSNSLFSMLANNRSKTPESKMTDESRNEKDAYDAATTDQKPHMINLAEEVLNPEDLVDQQGEREEHNSSKKFGSEVKKDVIDESDASPQTSAEVEKERVSQEPEKETIAPVMSRSRSWNIASALKRSISGDQSRRVVSETGAREETSSPTLGLLNLLSGSSTKKAEKPKSEEPRPQKQKPTWKAAVDPSTGTTYYYHRVTRQTTWTKPPDFDKERLPKEIGVKQSMSAEQQRKVEEGVEVPNTSRSVSGILLNTSTAAGSNPSQRPYTKKQEHIKELLLNMSPPDPASVDKIIDEYRGREDELIDQLNEIVESQPFDEPIKKADGAEGQPDNEGGEGMKKQGSFRLPLSTKSRSLKNRVMTASSNFTGRSTTTGRSNFSGNSRQTLKTGNTTSAARNSARMYPVASDLSRSSIDRPGGSAQGRPPLPSLPVPPAKKPEANEQPPAKGTKTSSPLPEMARKKYRQKNVEESSRVKVVKAPRNRELLVEEFSNNSRFGLRAEKYSGKASARRRPFREPRKPFTPRQEPSEKETTDEDTSGVDHESFATDSVSGLSASDAGFNTRKDEFDAAARSALDDAIRNRDWELAATVTDEMRGEHNHHETSGTDDETPDEWTQSSLDKFISDNDWVKVEHLQKIRYIFYWLLHT